MKKREKGFLLSLTDNIGKVSPERIILAKNRKKALRAIEYLPGYSVDGKEVFFSGIGCSNYKCELREVPILRVKEKSAS